MNYKVAVSRFKTLYERWGFNNQVVLKELQPIEILAEISVQQAELGNKYQLVQKSSRANTTPQTNLVLAQDVYTAGTGANNIPTDFMGIVSINLSDTLKTTLTPTGRADLKDSIKPNGRPFRYALYFQNGTQTLELDTYPDATYEMTIQYVQKLEVYNGTADNTNTTWSDLDWTNTTTYGGSLKLPSNWDSILIERAVAYTIMDANLIEISDRKVRDTIASANADGDYNLISFEGIGFQADWYKNHVPGQDYPRNNYNL